MLFVFLFFLNCSQKPGPTYYIDFQAGFTGQKVSLAIDGCLIVDEVEMVSDRVLDLAFAIRVFKGGVLLAGLFDTKVNYCQLEQREVHVFFLKFGDREFTKYVHVDKGEYIGISNAGGVPFFDQRPKPFYYD